MTVYLSGPMSGVDNYREIFDSEAAALSKHGFAVINPANLDSVLGDTINDYEAVLKLDMKLIDLCDQLVYLPGSEHSFGACVEIGYACIKGIRVMSIEDILNAEAVG